MRASASGFPVALWVTVALASVGCVSNPAPRGWLGPAPAIQANPFGAWIVISTRGDGRSGEFLAVEADSIFVLVGDTVHSVPVNDVLRAQIALYDAEWGKLAWWTTLGSVSTISHGFFLVLSFPVWVIGGSIAAGAQSRAPLRQVERADQWNVVRMYARYPTGLPPNLPRRLPPRPLR